MEYWRKYPSFIIKYPPCLDKTNKMIRVPSKDSDQVGHLTSLNVTVIFLQLVYASKGLPRSKLVSPFQQYFSHIVTMEWWTWKALCNETPFHKFNYMYSYLHFHSYFLYLLVFIFCNQSEFISHSLEIRLKKKKKWMWTLENGSTLARQGHG